MKKKTKQPRFSDGIKWEQPLSECCGATMIKKDGYIVDFCVCSKCTNVINDDGSKLKFKDTTLEKELFESRLKEIEQRLDGHWTAIDRIDTNIIQIENRLDNHDELIEDLYSLNTNGDGVGYKDKKETLQRNSAPYTGDTTPYTGDDPLPDTTKEERDYYMGLNLPKDRTRINNALLNLTIKLLEHIKPVYIDSIYSDNEIVEELEEAIKTLK